MDEAVIQKARMRSPLGKIPVSFYVSASLTLKDPTGKPIRGLFTRRFLRKGALIGEYRGQKIDESQTQRKRRFTQYFFAVSDLNPASDSKNNNNYKIKFVIDGANSRKSSFLRYVNAPNRIQDANTRFVQYGDAILLYATRNINPHTELLAWYGNDTKHILNQR
jgi:hypothetical protein